MLGRTRLRWVRITDLYADPSLLKEWIEVWDHVGDIGFRGFIGENDLMRSLFVFFDSSVIGKNLKPGYVALFFKLNHLWQDETH